LATWLPIPGVTPTLFWPIVCLESSHLVVIEGKPRLAIREIPSQG
jgi:hypothetical protein